MVNPFPFVVHYAPSVAWLFFVYQSFGTYYYNNNILTASAKSLIRCGQFRCCFRRRRLSQDTTRTTHYCLPFYNNKSTSGLYYVYGEGGRYVVVDGGDDNDGDDVNGWMDGGKAAAMNDGCGWVIGRFIRRRWRWWVGFCV